MKNKAGKLKLKRKGATNVFGCELSEYLESSGQDVPIVLKSCAEFIETHGIVDGIYRLSGVTSNIQKLRQEFGSDQCPDLTREIYLQDIHCVGSLCKLYFRELPNPLLTYELYKKFTEAVSCVSEKEQLAQIQNVIQELPPSHYRTLEYLSKHLALLASFSGMTNMHTRNLALVWAPNLLRSKEIEAEGCNGDAAFLEVRVQQLVIEFILNHVDEIFSDNVCVRPKDNEDNEENKPVMKSLTLPSTSLPMKLVSLEEAQARSLSACHPARKERRENSLPEIVPATGSFFHTVLDLPDSKRKLSTKPKKWKSIFNLGRSGSEAKTKLSRNGSVFVRGQKISEKATIRPAKSMDSLCSLPVEGEDEKGHFKRTITTGGFFVPMMKQRLGGPSSSFDLNKQDTEWDLKGAMKGAEGGAEDNAENHIPRPTQMKPLPEQLKVFRATEDPENEQTSPKMCRMFFTSNDGTSNLGFHGTLFPLEASPRHQHKALNISEPFAVSVPLRVSAVISINSTPCRMPVRDKAAFSGLQESSFLGKESAISSVPEGDNHDQLEHVTVKEEKKPESKSITDSTTEKIAIVKKLGSVSIPQVTVNAQDTKSEGDNCSQLLKDKLPLEQNPLVMILASQQQTEKASQDQFGIKDMSEQISWPPELSTDETEDKSHLKELVVDDHSNIVMKPLWPDIQQELKIVESEEEFLCTGSDLKTDEQQQQREFKPSLTSVASSEAKSFVCSSLLLPTPSKEENLIGGPLPISDILSKESQEVQLCNSEPFRKQSSIPFTSVKLQNIPCSKNCPQDDNTKNDLPSQSSDWKFPSELKENTAFSTDKSSYSKENNLDQLECESKDWLIQREKKVETATQFKKSSDTHSERDLANSKIQCRAEVPWVKKGRMNDQNSANQQEEDTWSDHVHGLELLEPWEDHQWVTSPLHSPTLKETQGKALQEFQPQNQGMAQSHFKKPCFSRSFSLDSKDFLKAHWAIEIPLTNAHEEQLCGDLEQGMKEYSPGLWKESFQKAEAWLNCLKETSNSHETNTKYLSHKAGFAATELPSSLEGLPSVACKALVKKEVPKDDKNQENMKLDLPLSQFNTEVNLLNSNCTGKQATNIQRNDRPGVPVMKGPCCTKELQINKGEDIPCKGKPRPSSLNLDSVLPLASHFNFDNLSFPSSPRHFLCGQKDAKSSDSAPSLPVACPSENKTDLWGSHFDPQDLDLEYIMMAHATTGRRNSAPVSVSAVRTSFMVKMCQARAVPVIPPKIQYTQVPQPLQAQNPNCRIPVASENKQTEVKKSLIKPIQNAQGQLQLPKSPPLDGMMGKENNSTLILDSAATRKAEPPFPNHNTTQDAPVLRRKRTSEGETTGDTPQSSKMERPSGVSKPSYRSRPGRPQSLILFSPPFPIMDHPSSADSRVLLSPIRSPTQTPSPSPILNDLLGAAPEGVTLRNKMTIPKNGQRLETSTSCFYQPQRRSVILDGRSGRQIE
ncbi:rho GTPase-activating protein 31 [Pantherophis guttatus]|uniref:Rho GTPase-activating protein 31 n=1 Tax=Pantherophis guttatus TaxID=94885 RepID=A0ABM3Z1L9_PANGU|nr:rho GTPase-activating protein 31 [Pantherophis guttatus]